MERFDRSRIRFRPVTERKNKFRIDDIAIDPDTSPPDAGPLSEDLDRTADDIRSARQRGAPVVICHGAHLIKNGLGPMLARLVRDGWLTHVATNGAGSLHDWEFAHLGSSCEDVRENVAVGEFGIWDETGAYIGLALLLAGLDGCGYGEAVGRMIARDRLEIPDRAVLQGRLQPLARGESEGTASMDGMAAAADLLAAFSLLDGLPGGRESGDVVVPHPWKSRSIQYACFETGAPFTVHPGIGQDIVYTHPLFRGGAVGRAAMADFLAYAAAIERLQGGVYLSVGSSVMSPMIFEKSLSMARNVWRQKGERLEEFTIVVNDLAEATWDWSRGEPPVDHPAYYVRFCKSFSRMGGSLRYVGMDNRVFLQNLYARLRS